MTGLLIMLTILCCVLVVWNTVLTYLYHSQCKTLEAYEKFSKTVLDTAKKIESTLSDIDTKYQDTAKEVDDFKQYIINEFDMYKIELANEKKLAVKMKEDADAVMKAYRASIVDAASKQRIVTKEDGTRVIEAVSDKTEEQKEREDINGKETDDHS